LIDANNASCAKQWPKCQSKTPKYAPSQYNKMKKKPASETEKKKTFGLDGD